jgi:hypothetical protein
MEWFFFLTEQINFFEVELQYDQRMMLGLSVLIRKPFQSSNMFFLFDTSSIVNRKFVNRISFNRNTQVDKKANFLMI